MHTADSSPHVTAGADRRLARSLLEEALGLLSSPASAPTRTQGPRTVTAPSRPRGHPRSWTRETGTAALLAFAARVGRPPTSTECRTPKLYSIPGSTWMATIWGSRVACYRALGLPVPPPAGRTDAFKGGK